MSNEELSYYEQFRSPIDNKFHYLYKITNLVNNKYYYGIHSTSNINDGYMGSGSALRKAIKKYGKDNFRKDILYYFNNRIELLKKENDIVNEQVLKDNRCYNIAEGGKQGSNKVIIAKDKNGNILAVNNKDERWLRGELVGVTKGYILCKDKNGNISVVNNKDERWLSGELVGVTKGFGTFLDEDNNVVHTSLDDIRIKNGQLFGLTTGRKHIYKDNDEKLVLIKDLNKYIDNGWKIGSPKSSSSKGKIYINNKVCNKLIDPEIIQQYLDKGWEIGRIKYNIKKKICIYKDNITKRIYPEELKIYVCKGWKKGVSFLGSRNPLRNK